MQIKDCMKRTVFSITVESTIAEAARVLAEKHIGSLPVVDADGKLVVVLHRFPIWKLMSVNRIRRESADAHRVGPKKISRFFNVAGKEYRIIRKGSLLGGYHPIHEDPQVLKHLPRGSRHGMLGNEPLSFLLKLRTEVPPCRPVETTFSFVNSLNFVVNDSCSGAVHPPELMNRERVSAAF